MRARAPTVAVAVAAAAVLVVAIVAAIAGPVRVGEPVISVGTEPNEHAAPEPTETASPPPEPDPEDAPAFLSVGVIVLTLVIVGFALVTLVALFVVGLRGLLDTLRARAPDLLRPPRDDPAIRITEALQEAADEAAREVAAAPPGQAGDAVVRCWVLLERVAQEAGTPRDPAATPTEFTAALLAEHSADPDAVRTLLRLYHRARFGDGRLPDQAAVLAQDAPDRISAGLSASHRGSTA